MVLEVLLNFFLLAKVVVLFLLFFIFLLIKYAVQYKGQRSLTVKDISSHLPVKQRELLYVFYSLTLTISLPSILISKI